MRGCPSEESFKAEKQDDRKPPDDPGNPTVNFHGEKRSNETHESTTDPEAKLARKGNGQAAKLSYLANALMENRNGLIVDLHLQPSPACPEVLRPRPSPGKGRPGPTKSVPQQPVRSGSEPLRRSLSR
jgi:hypothetical protein